MRVGGFYFDYSILIDMLNIMRPCGSCGDKMIMITFHLSSAFRDELWPIEKNMVTNFRISTYY